MFSLNWVFGFNPAFVAASPMCSAAVAFLYGICSDERLIGK